MAQVSRLIGNLVFDADGAPFGSIDELIFSSTSGRMSHLVLKRPDGSRACLTWEEIRIADEHFVLRRKPLA